MSRLGSAALVLLFAAGVAGCGGGDASGALSLDTTRECFESKGYGVAERTDLGELRPTYADEWYTVRSGGADFLAVTFFKSAERAAEARKELVHVAKAYAKHADTTLADSQLDAVVRTSANALYWWRARQPEHERDVERCLTPE